MISLDGCTDYEYKLARFVNKYYSVALYKMR